MGAGKTTLGKRLAQARGMQFIDSDEEIESRTGVDITYIFEKEGESGFRKRESCVIDDLTQRSGIVLATGGGAILDPVNRAKLSSRGFVIYLCASLALQVSRTTRARHRPLLRTGEEPRVILRRLFEQRDPLYREVADLVIPTEGRNSRGLVREIQKHLKQVPDTP
tara:strand:- start:38137 stop:38634 length:498 start_codon:yes stop_codon:yes gene_type:complete